MIDTATSCTAGPDRQNIRKRPSWSNLGIWPLSYRFEKDNSTQTSSLKQFYFRKKIPRKVKKNVKNFWRQQCFRPQIIFKLKQSTKNSIATKWGLNRGVDHSAGISYTFLTNPIAFNFYRNSIVFQGILYTFQTSDFPSGLNQLQATSGSNTAAILPISAFSG